MTTQSPETQREPSYRDAQLHKAMRLHRAAIKTNPQARKTLAAAEKALVVIALSACTSKNLIGPDLS